MKNVQYLIFASLSILIGYEIFVWGICMASNSTKFPYAEAISMPAILIGLMYGIGFMVHWSNENTK